MTTSLDLTTEQEVETPEQAIEKIAPILHRLAHPTYDTVTWCTFCRAAAEVAVALVDD